MASKRQLFSVASTKSERYSWLQKALIKWFYQSCSRSKKGPLQRFMTQISGYSPAQLKRLIKQQRDTGKIVHHPARGNGFSVIIQTSTSAYQSRLITYTVRMETDNKGKQRKRYLYRTMMTPFEKFKTLALLDQPFFH